MDSDSRLTPETLRYGVRHFRDPHVGAVAGKDGARAVGRGPQALHDLRLGQVVRHQQQRAVIGGDVADDVLGRTDPLRSQFLTGDQNLIHMRTVVQYSVAAPPDYLFRTEDIAQLISAAVEAERPVVAAHASSVSRARARSASCSTHAGGSR